jgi:hypothetical protein
MQLIEALRTTGAVREFTQHPVDDDTVARILDNARFAPSGGNKQSWRVVVVRLTDDGTGRALFGAKDPLAPTAVIALGYPVRQPRGAVDEFTTVDRIGGSPLRRAPSNSE